MLSTATLHEDQAQTQPGPSTRSVEGDVKRLADIRASLQDIQRRKSAPVGGHLNTRPLGRLKSQTGSLTPPQRFGENAYSLLHSSPYLINNRQQPFAQRDLNRDTQVISLTFQWHADIRTDMRTRHPHMSSCSRCHYDTEM